jgi:hypothetical protein
VSELRRDVACLRWRPVAPQTAVLNQARSVLHVEVGGIWGGSLRALQVYLAHSDRRRFTNDLLLYYPTSGMEVFRPLVRRLRCLWDVGPANANSAGPIYRWLRDAGRRALGYPAAQNYYRWIRFVCSWPAICRIRHAIRESGCDIVHVNNTFTFQPSTLAAACLEKVPAVAHVRGPVPPGFLAPSLNCRIGARPFELRLSSASAEPNAR